MVCLRGCAGLLRIWKPDDGIAHELRGSLTTTGGDVGTAGGNVEEWCGDGRCWGEAVDECTRRRSSVSRRCSLLAADVGGLMDWEMR